MFHHVRRTIAWNFEIPKVDDLDVVGLGRAFFAQDVDVVGA